MVLSKRDQAYRYLRERIVSCRIKPGEPLDEKRAAEELGFSRMPVREAVNKLAEEHLVNVFPSRGVIVSPISSSDYQEMLDIRLLVEPYLLHRSWPVLSDKDLLEFRAVMTERLENPEFETDSPDDDFDYRFHMYFANKSGSRYLISLMNMIMTQSQRIRFFSAVAPQRTLDSYREHVTIIDAVIDGDEDAAVKAVRAHLTNTREGYMRISQSREDFFRA
ncbi:GntR family transcriptional regulator [Bifidobacterium sp. 82T24]|uniref:GntR family transcriptional regulator n=1 Tax=Bifidobacterium pluvialisilvae TaxID=2834436 RepID=UPI001C566F80|nr:GntR family transcriptional regulator [Bifidobacterium pluvialisilvae]MBW3088684.1 GntR family transcriptional regulator [Bifidobacterium pluvialisilvae]